MRSTVNEVLKANEAYSEEFSKRATKEQKAAVAPLRKAAFLCCMDARIDPAKLCGLQEGDFHVIRNGGGRATDDALRSLVASTRLLGTHDWFVVHHTDCGFSKFAEGQMEELLSKSTATATYPKVEVESVPGVSDGSHEGRFVKWLPFGEKDLQHSVCVDVQRLAAHPLVPKTVGIYGMTLDTSSGKLSLVKEAQRIGIKE